MKFLVMIIVFLTVSNAVKTVHVGIVRNASLMLMLPSNITMNASTYNECLCAMLMNTGNYPIVSFNCYIKDIVYVVCQLFTMTNYQMSSSYQIQTNVNSTFYFLRLPFNNQSEMTTMNTVTTSEGTTGPSSSKQTTISTITAGRSIVIITRAGDSIVGVYNTTAGGSTGGKNGIYANAMQFPPQAIDNLTSTKYLNFGTTGGYGITTAAPGVGTGFYVTPAISNASIAISLRVATADDFPNRDPITVTLEGSNTDAMDDGLSWTLIYNGSTGIDATTDPGRMQYVPQQNFSNTNAYKSYRLLVTSQRGPDWAVQYSEAQIIGYV